MDADDGTQVLLDLVGPKAGTFDEARAFARRLGGLPLALRLAGFYLATMATAPPLPKLRRLHTFADYHAALDKEFSTIIDAVSHLDIQYKQGARELIAQTWELSLDMLQRRGQPQARPLLRLLSCLGPAPITYELLNSCVLASSPLFNDLTAEKLLGWLQSLTELGLIENPEDAENLPR